MWPAAAVALQPVRLTLWPARTRAEIVFSPGEQRGAQRLCNRLFGRPLAAWQYGGLAGAPDWARVEVGCCRNELALELYDPVSAVCRAVFYVRRIGDDLVLQNEGLRIRSRPLRRQGLGTQMFRRQLFGATALRIARVELQAGRNDDENGYYTWPRFGFDGRLPEDVAARLPPSLAHARGVSDLIESRQGRAWWREHGTPLPVAFDLRLHSRSRRVFDRYVRARSRPAAR